MNLGNKWTRGCGLSEETGSGSKGINSNDSDCNAKHNLTEHDNADQADMCNILFAPNRSTL